MKSIYSKASISLALACGLALALGLLWAAPVWAQPGQPDPGPTRPAVVDRPLMPNIGPVLVIPEAISATANSTVDVPVNYVANGNNITSIIYAIDYDQTWLWFDPSLPMSITLNLPNGYAGSCNPNTSDPFSEIQCSLFYFGTSGVAVPDGTIATIRLRTKNAPNNTIAAVNFSTTTPASFGDGLGNAVLGSIDNGSVKFPHDVIIIPPQYHYAYLPLTLKPAPVVEPVDPKCNYSLVSNSTMEPNAGYWYLPPTVKTAWFTNYRSHSASYSVYTGIDALLQPGLNIFSYSSLRSNNNQTLLIPANATKAILKFHYWPLSTEWLSKDAEGRTLIGENDPRLLPDVPQPGQPLALSPDAGDVQYMLVLDAADNILGEGMWDLANANSWIYTEVGLLKWRGVPIKLHWGTYNDNWNGVSAMYIDDVYLWVCTP